MYEKLHELEDKIGYTFKNFKHLRRSMTHSSYANEYRIQKIYNNERLEFLGDAVLEIVTSDYLFATYPNHREGDLTKMRASIVCEQTLALAANDIDLGSYILLGKGEEKTGGRHRASVVSDAMEALIGALYLDGGLESAKAFITKYILKDIKNKQLFYDSKTILQEVVQSDYTGELVYEVIGEMGPDHDKRFIVEARVGDEVIGTGHGRTKKAAEQEAAYNALMKTQQDE
ncbi:MAG: ribonuclease III [Lachnospiraceae bacterium]|nr:ribonuclease III [Lachnospiraceae bacterium]